MGNGCLLQGKRGLVKVASYRERGGRGRLLASAK